MTIFSLHEHELKESVDPVLYIHDVKHILSRMKIPGLQHVYQLKGYKGERKNRYAVLWIFENKEAIEKNFGTLEKPIWPEDWLYYENEILAKYLNCHPDRIHFTDYEVISTYHFKTKQL